MADVGYSSEYEVYLTYRNGMQIVTNELSLQILRELRRREVSPSEMAAALGLPKSTIQGNIGKLLRTGIIASETRIGDARSAVYHIEARQLFGSDTGEDWQLYARAASVARIIRDGRCTPREDLSLYAVSLMESGFNVVQGLLGVGAALTRGIVDRGWWDRQMEGLRGQCARRGISMEVGTEGALSIVLRSESEDISDAPIAMVPMLGALRAHSKDLFGYVLSHDILLSVEDRGRTVRIRIDPFDGQEFESSPYGIDPFDSFRIDEPFSVYSIEGRATLFTNPTMMGLLDALSVGDRSINELEASLRVPKATLYASLAKLTSLGAVGSAGASGSPKRYALAADPVMYVRAPNLASVAALSDIAARFREGLLDYYSAAISYALGAIDCMGIRFDRMFMRAGMNAALAVLGSDGEMEPKDFVDLSCTMVSGPDRAEVATYLPIRVRLFHSEDTLWDAWPADFVMGFLDEGLQQLLGFRYPIRIESHRAGAVTVQANMPRSRPGRPRAGAVLARRRPERARAYLYKGRPNPPAHVNSGTVPRGRDEH